MPKYTKKEFAEFLERLSKSKDKKVEINEKEIDDSQVKDLVAVLKKKKENLTELDLSDNEIGNKGAKIIAKFAMQSSTLTHLNLSYNNIKNNGAKALAKLLETSTTFLYLNLYGNKIEDIGAKALAEAITTNPNLKLYNLNVSNNKIGEKGILALAKAVTDTNSIQFIGLRDNEGYDHCQMYEREHMSTLQNTLAYKQKAIKEREEAEKRMKKALANPSVHQLNPQRYKPDTAGIIKIPGKLTLQEQETRWDGFDESKRDDYEQFGLELDAEQDEELKEQEDLLKQIERKNNLLSTNILDLSFGKLGTDLNLDDITENLSRQNSKITILKLTNNPIGNEGAKKLASALLTNKNLKELDLYNTDIGTEGGMALLEALKVNNNVTKIDLRNSEIPHKLIEDIQTQVTKNKEMQNKEEQKEFGQPSASVKPVLQTPLRATSLSRG